MESPGHGHGHGQDAESGIIFEQRLYKSLTLILKNVSDYLHLLEENVTFFNYHRVTSHQFTSNGSDDMPNSNGIGPNTFWFILQVFLLSGIVRILNRYFTKSSLVQQGTEVIFTWTIVILSLPLTILPLVTLLFWRALLSVFLRIRYNGVVVLMNPFDSVWSFENPHSTSTCIGLYVIKGDGDLGRIRQLLNTRVLEKEDENGDRIYDRFRWSIVNIFGFMCWRKKTPGYDLNSHIRHFEGKLIGPDAVWTEYDLFRELGELHDISLNRNGKSPWEILIIPKFRTEVAKESMENHYAIAFRIHHSIADGISMGHILHSCIGDEPFIFSVDPTSPLKISKFTVAISYIIAFLMLPQITLSNLFFLEKNSFHTEKILTGPKTFSWSRPIRLDTVKELKCQTNTSVFAVLLSCLTGSIRNLYEKHGQNVPDVIHACPPVAILPYPDRKPRNRFSIVLYPLATGKADPVERVNAVFKASKKLASSPEVLSNYYIVYILGLFPFVLLKFFAPLAHATLTFSNIPGPTGKVAVFNGDELTEIGAWIPIKNRIGIGMALFSYSDKLRVTFIGDKACLPNTDDVELLRDYFETEIVELSKVFHIKKENIFI